MKQIIIIRKDLNMRKGKMVAQGAHASIKATVDNLAEKQVKEWLNDGMKKICVGCESEDELRDLHNKARSAKLPCSIILDAGHTEFNKPTFTAVAIGPAKDEEIDKITKDLKLL
jgi:PTH2 family peptidyl-tRNA hydrolase